MLQSFAYVVYLSGPSPEGKYYIGQSGNFERRCRDHENATGSCPLFHEAIQRFGWNALRPVIIAQTDIAEEADRLERLYIAKYNALFPHGYNLTLGGRFTKFDPDAKITSFEEAPVSDVEILTVAQRRLTGCDCPVCGASEFSYYTQHCGVHPTFGKSILQHLIQSKTEDYLLPLKNKSLKKALLASKDGDFLINLSKSRLGVRKLDDALPVVAAEYAKRLLPYIRQSLKRDVLIEKKLPSYTLGRFIPFTGSKIETLTTISIERLLRKYRNQLGMKFVSNVEVFTKAFQYYGTTKRRTDTITRTLTERGASPEEITEAMAEQALISRIEEKEKTEQREYLGLGLSAIGNSPEPTEPNTTALTVTFSLTTYTKEDQLREADNLLAYQLNSLTINENKPALFIRHQAITPFRIISFDTLKTRRNFIDTLLAMDKKERLRFIQKLSTVASSGIWVEEIQLPPREIGSE